VASQTPAHRRRSSSSSESGHARLVAPDAGERATQAPWVTGAVRRADGRRLPLKLVPLRRGAARRVICATADSSIAPAEASPPLSRSQSARPAELGEDRTAGIGEVLYRVGDRRLPWDRRLGTHESRRHLSAKVQRAPDYAIPRRVIRTWSRASRRTLARGAADHRTRRGASNRRALPAARSRALGRLSADRRHFPADRRSRLARQQIAPRFQACKRHRLDAAISDRRPIGSGSPCASQATEVARTAPVRYG
jgi:hypothetical protein